MMTMGFMDYTAFLKRYDSRLGPESWGREFSPLALASGWQWWDDQFFRDEGLCYDRETGKFHRYTTEVKLLRNIQFAKYIIGEALLDAPFWRPQI